MDNTNIISEVTDSEYKYGFVYAGKKDKRNYMRQIEAIISTMKFAE